MKRTLVNLTCAGLGALLTLAALQWIPAYAQNEKPAAAKNPPPKLNVQDTPIQRDNKLSSSFAPIIKKAGPSVVSIFSSRMVSQPDMRNHPLFNDPMFRRFFGPDLDEEENADEGEPSSRRRRQEMGLGSGVIVSDNGYILTSNHVIEGADEVKVETDSGKEYVAKVIGTDPPTDTAVLKIEGENFPAMTIGNSDQLEVGDVCLAIGNPFGLGQTVTMGIVSATKRRGLSITDYDDFIQTDASINMGNSGGALIDAEGRLIGINTAILSRSGGNMGVGFAVPINMARSIMERLTQFGKVSRGFLGVGIQPVTPDLAKQFKLADTSGALVSGFTPGSPAEKAGIKAGDLITEVNGTKVADSQHLRLMISQIAPDTDTELKVLRDGKERTFKVKLAELSQQVAARGELPSEETNKNEALEGVEVGDLDSRTRRQFSIPTRYAGALVTNVDPESNSYEAGLRPGDVILEINRKPVRDAEEAVNLTEKVDGGQVLLRIYSRGNTRFLTIENGKNDDDSGKDNKAEPKPQPRRRN